MNNTEIIRNRNQPPRLHIKPWDETVCSVIPLNTNRHISLQPYQTADGYEYNWILTKKPERNVVQMAIETEGLDFFYQPRLTAQEIVRGCHRPENVVGSYAVYHKTMAGDYTQLGGKNYLTGKAFHDYRPRPTDAKGRWCWGKLHYDLARGIRSVIIPWWFLEQATYPVYHAAGLEFGYHTVGGTMEAAVAGVVYGSQVQSTSGSGTLQKITWYCADWDSAGDTVLQGVYSDSSGAPGTKIAVDNVGVVIPDAYDPQWRDSATLSGSIVNNTYYWGAILSVTAPGRLRYWSDAGGITMSTQSTYASLPDTIGSIYPDTKKLSWYATYAAPIALTINGVSASAVDGVSYSAVDGVHV
jgi:hypothetical protein